MTEPLFETSEHPTPEALAALAEPGAWGWTSEEMAGHLARCRRCMAAYAEFVDTHLRTYLDPDIVTTPSELIALGMTVPGSYETASRWGERHGRTQGLRLRPALGLLAALAVAMLISAWPLVERHPTIPAELRRSVAEQLSYDSQGGLLYSAALMPRPRQTRGADGELAIARELEHMAKQYGNGSRSAEVTYWLVAGLLATNQTREVDPYLRDAIEHFPKDARFQNLAAILSYKRDDPNAAETHLRAALAIERSPVALVNLAIVRRQQGAEGEAQALLAETSSRSRGERIASYAQELSAAR